MAKYDVYETVTYDRYQQVEANSSDEAIEIAKQNNDWQRFMDSEYEYSTYQLKEDN